ncbi:FmdB family zinc ribbon protein [Acidisphaera sp. S103]|uniref:FmdB family zinc ribbon protein n=1 Tax=Acidisphaera sp. S103 TaxID=1747223 RepID=UPI00131CC854|nr:zinc ribbon domain-containing protein [Acidisphaera sp. S103]
MPTYEYECPDCGPFSDVRPMAEFDQPQPCPDCEQPAPRLLTAPALAGSAQETTAGSSAPAHAGGCACCMPRRLSAEAV